MGRDSFGDALGGAEWKDQFKAFAEALRRELAPRTVLEQVLADRVILSAWTLQAVAAREHAAIRHSVRYATGEESPERRASSRRRGDGLLRRALLVAQCLETALDLLRRFQQDNPSRRYQPPAFDADFDLDSEDVSDFSNEWPVAFRGRSVADEPDTEAEDVPRTGERGRDGGGDRELAGRWQDRLVFDFNVSESSPVVRGTWVTVSHVVSLIVDGWSWSDILRTHPELTEDDIRTCLAYTVAQDKGSL